MKEQQEKMEQENMTLDEMRRIVHEADDVEFGYRQAEQRDWEREQRAKAPEVRRRLKISCPLPSAATVSVMRFGVI